MASLQYKGKHFCGGSLVINFFIMPWIIITITATTLTGKMITYPNYFDKKSDDNQSTRIRIIMVTGLPSLGAHRGSLSWLSKRWRLSSSSLCCFGQQRIPEFPSSQFHHNFIVISRNAFDCKWFRERLISLIDLSPAEWTGLLQRWLIWSHLIFMTVKITITTFLSTCS